METREWNVGVCMGAIPIGSYVSVLGSKLVKLSGRFALVLKAVMGTDCAISKVAGVTLSALALLS